jgi:signal transduction histidine kinase
MELTIVGRLDSGCRARAWRFGDVWETSRKIILLTTRGLSGTEYFQKVLSLMLEITGGRSVELCLIEGEQHRHFVARAALPGDVDFRPGNQRQESTRGRCLLALWKTVVDASHDHTVSNMTPFGSFWTNDVHAELPKLFASSASESTAVFDISEDTASLAIVPLTDKVGKQMGVVRITGTREDRFDESDIQRFEALVDALGMGILNLRVQSALQERIKELACLYDITKLVELPEKTLGEVLQGVADLLPPAWQYPGSTSAKIVLDGRSYATADVQETFHTMRSPIVIEGRRRGVVEVSYTQQMPTIDEGPFLREERSLLNAIAQQVALIIERRETEENKARLEDQLRHADRLATIGQLAAGVAHELNEPLGNILGFAQLAKKHEGIGKEVLADLEKIVSASLYSREVIKKLMLFSRQTPPIKVKIDLNQVLEQSISLLEGRCDKQGIEVIRALSPDIPRITADPGQMNQVIVNLIVNSIHAMREGGRLVIRTSSADGSVILGVSDTGTGMTDDVLEKVFLPFYTTKDVDEGTGLGLAVVNGIVTSHGGFIKVDSLPGKGSTFEVHLPVSEPGGGLKQE